MINLLQVLYISKYTDQIYIVLTAFSFLKLGFMIEMSVVGVNKKQKIVVFKSEREERVWHESVLKVCESHGTNLPRRPEPELVILRG